MSRERLLVDWGVAERVATTVITGVGPLGASSADTGRPRPEELRRVCAQALELATAYAGLGTVADPPAPELIDRTAWARNALDTLAEAATPLEERMLRDLRLPGALGGIGRRVLGGAAGAEAGLALGYAGRRVIGQYDVALFGPERPGRLLFVAENMANAQRELNADPGPFLRWIALHECTHVIQLECVAWLKAHLRRLATELVESAAEGLEGDSLRELGRRLLSDPRELVRTAMRGELAQALAGPEQRRRIEQIQATMTVVEGHAEHVMDAAAQQLDGGDLDELRRGLERRRANRGWVSELVGRLLGMDLKLRQYALGKSFCDEIAARGGAEALTALWSSAEELPTLAELERPAAWLERVGLVAAQAVG